MSKTIEHERGQIHVKCNGHIRDTFPITHDDTLGWIEDWAFGDGYGFRYRGEIYALEEFEQATPLMRELGFDGTHAESYFSAVVVKLTDDEGQYRTDGVVVGYVHW